MTAQEAAKMILSLPVPEITDKILADYGFDKQDRTQALAMLVQHYKRQKYSVTELDLISRYKNNLDRITADKVALQMMSEEAKKLWP